MARKQSAIDFLSKRRSRIFVFADLCDHVHPSAVWAIQKDPTSFGRRRFGKTLQLRRECFYLPGCKAPLERMLIDLVHPARPRHECNQHIDICMRKEGRIVKPLGSPCSIASFFEPTREFCEHVRRAEKRNRRLRPSGRVVIGIIG